MYNETRKYTLTIKKNTNNKQSKGIVKHFELFYYFPYSISPSDVAASLSIVLHLYSSFQTECKRLRDINKLELSFGSPLRMSKCKPPVHYYSFLLRSYLFLLC